MCVFEAFMAALKALTERLAKCRAAEHDSELAVCRHPSRLSLGYPVG